MARTGSLVYVSSLAFLVLFAAASIAGVVAPEQTYRFVQVAEVYQSNDLVNLLFAAPLLIVALVFARRKSFARCLWAAVLFYSIYNDIAYIYAMPPSIGFVLHVGLLGLGVYTLVALFRGIGDPSPEPGGAAGLRPIHRVAGMILALLGATFAVRAVIEMLAVATSGAEFNAAAFPVLVADLLIAPAWIVVGVMLAVNRPFGRRAGQAAAFHMAMLFIGLLLLLVLQPMVTGAAFNVEDFAVVAGMAVIGTLPAVFLARR